MGALKRLELLKTQPELRNNLWNVVNALQKGLRDKGFNLGHTQSPVTPVILSGNPAQGTNILIDLRENYNIFCSVVVYPVIPKGMILIRIIPTAAHSLADVERTIKAFSEVRTKLDEGKYDAEEVTLNIK